MKNNIRLSVLFAAIAAFVAGIGIESPEATEARVAGDAATSWSAAFPVAQAGFAHPTSKAD